MLDNEKRNQEIMDEPRESSLDYRKIGAQIRKARRDMGITQEELAWRLDCSPTCISNLERGLKGTSVGMLVHLASCLDVTVDQLLRGNQTADESVYIQEIHDLLDGRPTEEMELICDLTALVKEMFDCYTRSVRGGEAR